MPAPVIQFKRGNLANLPGLRAGEPAFTVDKYDLYVGIDSTTANNQFVGSGRYWKVNTSTVGSGVKLVEGSTNGTNSICIKSPDALAGDLTYVMPGVQGNASTVLTNDGSGNLTWSSGSADPTFTGISNFTDTTNNTLGDADTGSVIIDGGVGIEKNLTVGAGLSVTSASQFNSSVIFDSTGSIQVPVGTTAQRLTAKTGQIRYNTQLSTFEGYGAGNAWGSLGGVKDVDQDTYILAESAPGNDEDTLYFYNNSVNTLSLTERTLTVNTDANVSGALTAVSLDGDLNQLGNTIYVAKEGSDSNSGNNINEPYLTLATALGAATNGDIIQIAAGEYVETCPLTVPAGVTVRGASLRATTIKPSTATQQSNVFLLQNNSTIEDLTIAGVYYDTVNDTGYAFAYVSNATISTRSPYVQRVTVLNRGSVTSTDDPYGYDTADSPPTSYIAGRGAKVDGSVLNSASIEAGFLFNEVTFFTPNNIGVLATNGARIEYLNCFSYFASKAVEGKSGTTGFAGSATTRLRFNNPSTSPSVGNLVRLYDGGGTQVAQGTIASYSGGYATITGKGSGEFELGSAQDIRFFDGPTQIGTADAILLADYSQFGAEMRSVGCAFQYGSQGVVADGLGTQLRLFAANFNHVGSGKDFSNDISIVNQSNETVELNSGEVSYVSIDQSGNFRVGESFFVNQETGAVSFASTTFALDVTGDIDVTDGANTSNLSPTSLSVGALNLSGNTVASTTGDITIDPSAGNETNVVGNLNVAGILTAAVLEVSAVQKLNTSVSIEDTGTNGTVRIITDATEALTVDNSQRVGIGSTQPEKDLDVVGDARVTGDYGVIGNVTVSGTSALPTINTDSLSIDGSGAITSIDTDLAGGVSGADDSLATAKAIKTYIDTNITAQDLDIAAGGGTSGAVDLDSQVLTVSGTTNEVNTSISGQVITIGLVDDVTITQTITVGGNIIKSNGGTPALTLNADDVTVEGDLKLGANKIVDSVGADLITHDIGTDIMTIHGDLLVNGSDLKGNSGNTQLTLASAGAELHGYLKLGGTAGEVRNPAGNKIFDTDGTTVQFTGNVEASVFKNDDLTLGSTTGSEVYLKADKDAGVLLYFDNDKKFETTSTGARVTGVLSVSGNEIKANDGTDAITIADVSGDVTVNGDITVNGNDIKDSSGNAAITFDGTQNTVLAGHLKVDGNDIKSSTGATAIQMSGEHVKSIGNLTVGGNDIKASDGTQSITLTDSSGDVVFANDIQVLGNDIKDSGGGAAITFDGSSNVTASGNFTVTGDLFVNGTTTQVNTETLTVQDSLLDLGMVEGAVPTSNSGRDIGVLFNYYASGSAKKSAIYWDESAGRMVVSADVSEGSSTGILSSNTAAGLEISSLHVAGCTGSTVEVIGCSGSEIVISNATLDAGTF